MIYGLILLGGNKDLDHQGIPIQYVSVYDKPIFIYTLECFEKHPQIDEVVVVCLEGWENATKAFASQFNINKLRMITNGGKNGQESIRNGVELLGKVANEGDFVVIHDGTRPMLDNDVLTDVIRVAQENGNAITATPFTEQLFKIVENNSDITTAYLERDSVKKVTTPQAYRYGELSKVYEAAFREKKGIGNTAYTDTMMTEFGNKLFFAAGSDRNIKLETAEDIALFRALLDNAQPDWLK